MIYARALNSLSSSSGLAHDQSAPVQCKSLSMYLLHHMSFASRDNLGSRRPGDLHHGLCLSIAADHGVYRARSPSHSFISTVTKTWPDLNVSKSAGG